MVQVPEHKVERVVGVLRVAAWEPGRVSQRHRHHHQRSCGRKHEVCHRLKNAHFFFFFYSEARYIVSRKILALSFMKTDKSVKGFNVWINTINKLSAFQQPTFLWSDNLLALWVIL